MPGRVKGAWNLISKLAIVLNWKTPTRLKFGKTKICQEQNIPTFVYNKTGADSSEWFEPVEDAKNRSSTIQQQDPTHLRRQQSRRQPHRSTNAGSSSRRPRPTGAVYVANMNSCQNMPYGKIGSTTRTDNSCGTRIAELQTGNPHQLVCNQRRVFLVTGDLASAEQRVHRQLRDDGLHAYPTCRGGREWYSYPRGGLQGLASRVREVLSDAGVLAQRRDWVESSINPSLSPNQSPQFVYNSKWRQVPCKGDELQHITYNCKWHFSEVTCVTIARSRKWSIKCRYSNKRRILITENNFISAALE